MIRMLAFFESSDHNYQYIILIYLMNNYFLSYTIYVHSRMVEDQQFCWKLLISLEKCPPLYVVQVELKFIKLILLNCKNDSGARGFWAIRRCL